MQTFKNWISPATGFLRATASPTPDRRQALNLAVAALLVEVLRADYDVGVAERKTVIAAAGRVLGLGQAESEALVADAEREIDKSHDLYQFTSQVNRSFSEAEKVRLLEQLWRVARRTTWFTNTKST